MTVLEQAMGLPRSEKLRLMEALWTDLSLVEEGLDSPGWHGAALRETEARVVGCRRAADGLGRGQGAPAATAMRIRILESAVVDLAAGREFYDRLENRGW